jgi:hypothetical protein
MRPTWLNVAAASALALGLVMAGASALAQKGPKAADPGAAAQADLARKALQTIDVLREKTGQSTDAATIYTWSRRLVEAELASKDGKTERIAAAQAHHDRMKKLMEDSFTLYKNGEVQILVYMDAQYHYNEAVSLLAKVKAE